MIKKSSNWLTKIYTKKDDLKINENKILESFIDEKEDLIIFDVGANFGNTVKPFLDKKCQIYAFEPDPNNLIKLKETVNGYDNVKIITKAVSDENDKCLSFYNSEESPGISSLNNFTSGHKELCKVQTITLEAFTEQENINHIDYLKIDTEGFDFMVLKGLNWDKIKPSLILAEFEDFKTVQLGYKAGDMAEYLHQKGYKVFASEWYPIEKYGGNHKWKGLKTYPCAITDKGWGNLLAFKNEPDKDKLLNIINNMISGKIKKSFKYKANLLFKYVLK